MLRFRHITEIHITSVVPPLGLCFRRAFNSKHRIWMAQHIQSFQRALDQNEYLEEKLLSERERHRERESTVWITRAIPCACVMWEILQLSCMTGSFPHDWHPKFHVISPAHPIALCTPYYLHCHLTHCCSHDILPRKMVPMQLSVFMKAGCIKISGN